MSAHGEDRVLDGPASEEKGSKGRNWLDCIWGKGVRALVFRKESCRESITDWKLRTISVRKKMSTKMSADQMVFLNCLDLHHTPPISSERQYKSRT